MVLNSIGYECFKALDLMGEKYSGTGVHIKQAGHLFELYKNTGVVEYHRINPMCHNCGNHMGIVCSESYCSKGHDCRDGRENCEDRRFESPGC